MEERGLIHIYCGEGKGKTTAALGLAVRAAGRGKHVVIARFLKNDDSGEVFVLPLIPNITVIPCRKCFGFTFCMSKEEREEAAIYYKEMFMQAVTYRSDMIILDELIGACNAGFVSKEEVEKFLKKKPSDLEVVVTGRNPWNSLLELGDYITEMQALRHPYQKGIPARMGIEW